MLLAPLSEFFRKLLMNIVRRKAEMICKALGLVQALIFLTFVLRFCPLLI
jgi:hypothetical protein